MSKFTAVLYVLLTLTILLTVGGCGSGVGGGLGDGGDGSAQLSAQLIWDAPATNEDGTPQTDLAGYYVYYGTSPGNYATAIDVGNVTTYTVDNLSYGTTYYFTVTAYYRSGDESGYSNEVNKTI